MMRNIIYIKMMAVFWFVAPCNLVEVYPEDSHHLTSRRENLKSRHLYSSDQIKEYEIFETCSTHEMRTAYNILIKKLLRKETTLVS
jgi:hypothetical protein